MRNFFLTLIAFLFFSFAGNAQKFKVTNNQTTMLEKSGRVVNTVVKQNDYAGFDGKFHYFVVDKKTLLKTDESLKKITSVELPQKFESKTLTNFYSEGVAGLLCVKQNKNDFIIQKMTVSSKGLNETELLTIPASKGDYYQAEFSTSPDKKTKMIALTIASSKDEYKSTFIFVINNQGDVLWSQNFAPNFKEKSFNFSDMCVSNDGSVYVVATSYTDRVKKSSFHLFKLNRDEGISERNTLPFGFNRIVSMKMLVLSNGNIFIGGYYTEEEKIYNDTKDAGTFNYVFDAETLEKLNFSTKTLDATVPKDITPKTYKEEGVKAVKGIYETTDGKVTMFAERLTIITGRDIPTTYERKGVSILSFDLNGNYGNSSILFKNQVVHTVDALTSFSVLVNGDELILIYNDNAKNDISLNIPKVKQFIGFFYKKGHTIACSIKNGIIGKKQVIINAKEEERIFYNVAEQLESKEAIIRVQTGTAGIGPLMLEKLSW